MPRMSATCRRGLFELDLTSQADLVESGALSDGQLRGFGTRLGQCLSTGAEDCDCDGDWEGEDSYDCERDLRCLAAEAEWFLWQEENREHESDGCKKDLHLPALLAA
jgi:hypothetical protein